MDGWSQHPWNSQENNATTTEQQKIKDKALEALDAVQNATLDAETMSGIGQGSKQFFIIYWKETCALRYFVENNMKKKLEMRLLMILGSGHSVNYLDTYHDNSAKEFENRPTCQHH